MMRRIDRELDLPAHVAKKIKQVIQGLEESKKEIQEYLEKLRTGEIPSIEDRLKNLEDDHQTIKDSLETLSDAILQLSDRIDKIEQFLKEKFGF